MILLTIGTHEPFDRLVEAMDILAGSVSEKIVAQLSDTEYNVKNMEVLGFVPPKTFEQLFKKASFIVSHAGMGTILSAFEFEKPIIVFPRLASLRETRNEHQLATVKKLEAMGYINVAYTAEQLESLVLKGASGALKPLHRIGKVASSGLVDAVREFINCP
ncbi:glycosyltransferase [Niabella drilacis]|uniref:UDP-N-acetylglucosamine transferase subunit ALG13 n=1 Tax=Niabella drilacis (strain DSM 25811 / CCM 8410 / CCUG 62505 / LMG 26954 / E90) TaxID=1285928 RepID=A0A1G6LMF0_NIADE|nr:glycosyltransferase [Niabella drilacis]SDC44324.1 UDP-N-acetylglucosamine transferase subunit ALG13 [Niabella drilacis]